MDPEPSLPTHPVVPFDYGTGPQLGDVTDADGYVIANDRTRGEAKELARLADRPFSWNDEIFCGE